MLKIGNKCYRNLPEQVAKNMEDIANNQEDIATLFAAVAAKGDKLYFHRITINFKITSNATLTARIFIVSKDNEQYTLDDFKNLVFNTYVKIDIPTFIGDNLKTTTYEFRYASNDEYACSYLQLSGGALTNNESTIAESAITSFNDTIINF